MGYVGELRANTAVDVLIGPFLDDTDGKTAETGLTISQADVKLSKLGQALAQKNDDTAAAADAGGYYNCELDTTDTNTEGMLTLTVNESGALPVRHDFMVLSEAAWDSKYAAKDDGFMDVNVKTIGRADTQETEASNLESACANYSATRGLTGTALPAAAADAAGGVPISDAGGLDLDAKLAATNEVTAARMGALTDLINGGRLDLLIDAILEDTGTTIPAVLGTPAGASLAADLVVIDNFVDGLEATIGAAGAGLTAVPWNAAWDAEVQSECTDALNAYDPPTAAEIPAASAIADAVWDEALAGHADAGSAGLALATASSGGVDPSVLADAIWDEALSGHSTAGTSGKKLTDLANADLSGVATAASLTTVEGKIDTIDNYIDTEMAALTSELAKVPKSDSNVSWNATALAALQQEAADAITAAGLATAANLAIVAGYIDTEVAAILAAVDTEVAAIKAKTDNLPASPAAVGSAMTLANDAVSAAAMSDAALAEFKAQIVAALATDTYAEPAAIPAATTTLAAKIGLLAALARNKGTLNKDTGVATLYADDGTTPVGTRTDSDDDTTYVRGEFA